MILAGTCVFIGTRDLHLSFSPSDTHIIGAIYKTARNQTLYMNILYKFGSYWFKHIYCLPNAPVIFLTWIGRVGGGGGGGGRGVKTFVSHWSQHFDHKAKMNEDLDQKILTLGGDIYQTLLMHDRHFDMIFMESS